MTAKLPRFDRPLTAAIHDIVMAALSFVAALYLRLGSAMLPQTGGFLVEGTVLFTVVCGVVFWRMQLYRGVWRYASLPDLIGLLKAVTLAHLVFLLIMFFLIRLELYPRLALVINWFVLMALLGGPRFIYRLVKDGSLARVFERADTARVPVLLIGTGDAAEAFVRAMARDAQAGYDVVGLIADDPDEVGRRIRGVEVVGTPSGVGAALARLRRKGARPHRLILCAETTPPETLRGLLAEAESHGLTIARLGRLTDFRGGAEPGFEIRPVPIEDLLGRPQTVLDRAAMAALVAGQRVLVSGAGGTIGSELARQVAAFGPARLTLLDHAEFALYAIDQELATTAPDVERGAILADVRDRTRLDAAFDAEKPDLVFHAAALKHVHLAEANPCEAALTNAVGTRNAAEAARRAGAGTFVLISTDKAVNPRGVMGLTKRIAELTVLGPRRDAGTRSVVVRFGNVLGSTGSVVPLFQRQLARGGPLTVTDPEVSRFFMTVREAVELVLQASALPAEDGAIFVLEMGEPVRIIALARQMIRLAGLVPERDVRIEMTGLRPGEKLHEELFHADERKLPTRRPEISIALGPSAPVLGRRLDEIEAAARQGDETRTLALMADLVPGFHGEAHRRPASAHG
ncbi:MAG: polysaccharide biosynthesis protein [Alphaproteobacteria bacterium]|nr:polysaccharide biosynthesis protein [Alphaproteobacteria bacterium]